MSPTKTPPLRIDGMINDEVQAYRISVVCQGVKDITEDSRGKTGTCQLRRDHHKLTYDHELILSQKHAITILENTTNLLPQYPKTDLEVTAKGVWV